MGSRGNAITVDLPNENPFAEARPRGNRTGAQQGGRTTGGRGLTRVQNYDDAESVEDSYDDRRGNVTQLPNVNPFARDEPPRSGRSGGQLGARPAARRVARAQPDDGDDDGQYRRGGSGVIELPSENPFAPRGGNREEPRREDPRRGPRIIEPVYQPSESEPEVEVESDYEPAPQPRRANTAGNERPAARQANRDHPQSNERQRMGNSRNQLRSVAPQEDDRLVISWVDEPYASPPRSPSPRHRHRHSPSVTSESESYFRIPAHHPGRERSGSPERRHRSNSRPRGHDSHHDHGHHSHHSHHDRAHCRQCHRLAIPPWQPPFPMPPADWSGYGAPRSPYSPAPPYAYGRPLYSNIPDLPSLLDQCRVPYPPIPVAPVAFLRNLQAQGNSGSASTLSAAPTSNPLPVPTTADEWKNLLGLLPTGIPGTIPFMAKLKEQEFSSTHVDRVFRKLSDVVQVRFGERQGNEIVNRVHLVPRGRLAMGTVMANKPKIDVDLVVPSDFILRRWNISASETDESRPKTIADALELHPSSINRGEVEIPKLRSVFQAIWEQLNGSADGFIFPGGRDEAERYLPRDWCSPYKEDVQDSSRLQLQVPIGPGARMVINIFIKVSLSLYGQDMIVGVDQSSAKSGGKYQACLIKTLRTPGVPLSEPTLSPILRSAIILLCWSQHIVGILPPKSRIPASHFHLALVALQNRDPSDPLYIQPASKAESFSWLGVLQVVVKILSFLGDAYKPSGLILGAPVPGPSSVSLGPAIAYTFPLGSCTIMDTLYIQAAAHPVRKLTALLCVAATLAPFKAIELLLGGAAAALGSIADGVAGAAGEQATGALVGLATEAIAGVAVGSDQGANSSSTGGGSNTPDAASVAPESSGADGAPATPASGADDAGPVAGEPITEEPEASTKDQSTNDGSSSPPEPSPSVAPSAPSAPSTPGPSQVATAPKASPGGKGPSVVSSPSVAGKNPPRIGATKQVTVVPPNQGGQKKK
ncbi:unnamed protein product [Rhizoctonia solani]|uniref:Uncharacterized protein n=1 Tax=Rhizoctonia solani TaxID=456999 RepID=A0A8H2XA69_9AGAM|nr:unnamed protein product [Rhizoctonia solani]